MSSSCVTITIVLPCRLSSVKRFIISTLIAVSRLPVGLEVILESLTSNKWKAAAIGAGVTALIQSSGATTVMVVGFVNSEIMTLAQGAGIILGANVGTTITAWLLSLTGISGQNFLLSMLKPKNFAPLVGLIGIVILLIMLFALGMRGKKVESQPLYKFLAYSMTLFILFCSFEFAFYRYPFVIVLVLIAHTELFQEKSRLLQALNRRDLTHI